MDQGRSPESPMPVRTASRLISGWIRRLGAVWVEGQISQLRTRQASVFISLRDPDADMSIPLMAPLSAVRAASVEDGHRVVALVRPDYFPRNGSLSWRATEFRPVGLGALMQRLDQLRRTLGAEGLFRDERKQPLPFLPRTIGLICGKASAARHDVEVNARHQWPGAVFEVREVSVQGPAAVAEVTTALVQLDRMESVDVIIITRGGGSFEDLLPFSNESLVRAVAAARTPVVSAIGHEEDTPLLDLVADRRASTPTAAGRMVVPDVRAEMHHVLRQRDRLRHLARDRLAHERRAFDALRHRPVLASPGGILREQGRQVRADADRARRCVAARITAERARLDGVRERPVLARPHELLAPRRAAVASSEQQLRRAFALLLATGRNTVANEQARLRALSPQGTLDRGYAVVRTASGVLVRSPGQVRQGERLAIRVAAGQFAAEVAPGVDATVASTGAGNESGKGTPT